MFSTLSTYKFFYFGFRTLYYATRKIVSAAHNGCWLILYNPYKLRNLLTSRYSLLAFSRGECQFDVTLRFTQKGRALIILVIMGWNLIGKTKKETYSSCIIFG